MPGSPARARSVVVAALAALAVSSASGQQPAPPAASSSAAISFDMVVVDRDGREPERLAPSDITVQVDGRPRRIVAVRRVSRGPGATIDASTRQVRSTGPMTFAAEPIRNVLVVVDQASLVRGEERAAITASQALLDRIGVSDRLAVVLLPLPRDQMLSLATEQPVARETLAQAVGRIDPAVLTKPDPAAFPPVSNPMMSDPDRVSEAEAAPTPAPAPAPVLSEADSAPVAGTLYELAGLLETIRTVPGRKVVALFSAGITNAQARQISAVAAAAVSARAVIHVFAVSGPRFDSAGGLQMAPLETLARSTGGAVVTPGRNPERVLARTAMELGSCYVVELEPAPTDADGRRHALRVDVAGRGLSVRAPAWLVPSSDPGDTPVVAPGSAATGSAGSEASGTPDAEAARAAAPRATPPSSREAELQVALARLTDYVEAYQRQFSGLVAEEEYKQSFRSKNLRLRSDYLLVKPQDTNIWVSFRDVFEVDGVAVRDRDDRLRRLFLEPGVDISTQLMAIKAESTRYNLSFIERDLNMPLVLLRYLTPEYLPRFRFRLAGTHTVAGVEAWRIEFEQRTSPTIIRDRKFEDVRSKGWLMVEVLTGAVVESGWRIEEDGADALLVVSFRRDDTLGMWVPSQMTEDYRMLTQRSMRGAPGLETILEGTATYSKFRRFQVKIEEKLVNPK